MYHLISAISINYALEDYLIFYYGFFIYTVFKGCFPFIVITKYWLSSSCCTTHPWACLIPSSLYLPFPCLIRPPQKIIYILQFLFFSGDVEELEIQEKPALKVFKNITVIQEPGMVILEVRWDHLPKLGGENVLSSNVIIEKIGFFQIRKKKCWKIPCVYFPLQDQL